MKRILKFGGIGLLAVIVAAAVSIWLMFGGMQSAQTTEEVNQIQYVSDGFSAVAIVPTRTNEALLIDAGNDPNGEVVLAELQKMGLTSDSVSAILFTHGHGDHIAAARQFPKANLMSLAPEVDLIAGLVKPRGPVVRLFPVAPTGLKVTQVLEDGETLVIGQAAIKVFAIPGHTAGSAAYLVNGVLFLGDSADATSSGKLQSSHWIFSDDLGQNEASLRSLEMQLQKGGDVVQAIAFAHSGILQDGLAPLTAWVKAN